MGCVHVIVEGRVQGVFYRAWTERNARSLGLSGWVRNRRDGSVEAVFCGEDGAVGEMLARCRAGPPEARVARVTAEPLADAPAAAGGFAVRPTE